MEDLMFFKVSLFSYEGDTDILIGKISKEGFAKLEENINKLKLIREKMVRKLKFSDIKDIVYQSEVLVDIFISEIRSFKENNEDDYIYIIEDLMLFGYKEEEIRIFNN